MAGIGGYDVHDGSIRPHLQDYEVMDERRGEIGEVGEHR
jgi:hypothetical protein